MVDACEQAGTDVQPRDGSIVVQVGGKQKRRSIKFYDRKGEAYFEGDIRLGQTAAIEKTLALPEKDGAPQAGSTFRGLGILGAGFRWPSGKVPYQIEESLARPERLAEAIRHWESKTAIRFELLPSGAKPGAGTNYILFCDRGGCWSYVGMQGGQQELSLGAECSIGNAIHEVGHAVGLWHEHSRADREEFVAIDSKNISNGMKHNFDQHIKDGIDLGHYDYGSIMHYPAAAFSSNGGDTIVPKDAAEIGKKLGLTDAQIAQLRLEQARMGQRQELSAIDVASIQKLYA